VQTVVGLDKNVSVGSSSLLLIAQYIGISTWKGTNTPSLMCGTCSKTPSWPMPNGVFNNGWTFNFVGVYNLDSEDFYLKPELSYTTASGIKFMARANILEGPEESFFGSYTANDRVQCKVEYRF
jgi:hypothetical protein